MLLAVTNDWLQRQQPLAYKEQPFPPRFSSITILSKVAEELVTSLFSLHRWVVKWESWCWSAGWAWVTEIIASNDINLQADDYSIAFRYFSLISHNYVSTLSYITMNSKFSYGIAASFNAKNMEFNPLANFFNFDPYAPIIKKREDKRTRPASGEDAFFISRVGKSGDVAFGVADGVGGWDDINIDPADFSHQLCDYMAYAACPIRSCRISPKCAGIDAGRLRCISPRPFDHSRRKYGLRWNS